MSRLWDETPSKLGHSDLLILLVLADHANDDGICWPSATRIATRAKLSERQVRRRIDTLEAQGYIEVERREGKTSRVRLVSTNPGHQEVTPDTESPLTSGHPHPGHLGVRPTPDTQVSDEPSGNLQVEPSSLVDLSFEGAWRLWPNKNAKKPALDKFRKLVKDKRFTASELGDVIKEYGVAYANSGSTFTPHLRTWLNQERWSDPLPVLARVSPKTDSQRMFDIIDIDMTDSTLEDELTKRINPNG